MADWRQQYIAALKARDEREQADKELIDQYTRLADRKAETYAELRALQKTTAEAATTPASTAPPPLVGYGWGRQQSPQPAPESTTLAQMRQDFTKAQQDRALQQTQLEALQKDMDALQAKAKADQRKISQLSGANAQLTTKLRDREEEIRGKAKLLVDVQDENVTLNLQLNVAEEQSKKLKKENQDLIDRWMARKGKEAEDMNQANKFK